MKKKDKIELAQKSLPELIKVLEELRNKLVKFKMEIGSGKTKNVRGIARTRDEIARVLTRIQEEKLKRD